MINFICIFVVGLSILPDVAVQDTSPVASEKVLSVVSPLTFALDEIAPFLGMDAKQIEAQKDFAKRKGYVKYTMGLDRLVMDDVVDRIISVYDHPPKRDDDRLVWKVDNPDVTPGMSKFVEIVVCQSIEGQYVFKVDVRKKSIYAQDVLRGTRPLASEYRTVKEALPKKTLNFQKSNVVTDITPNNVTLRVRTVETLESENGDLRNTGSVDE
ncbi:MAG: hypothetical protein ACSHXY_08980 [Alphaproteobacteria bacterium]